ncbi:cation:proton antiporter [Acidovorax sp.]|uniref:cation:proton antiporter domain-containing protein n=1 Tax=Acidovorax sp. TaxID=1872122 RepID=UPI00341CA91B
MSDELMPAMAFALVGLLLVVMTLTSSFIARVPLSSAILYLAVGVGIGPWGLGLLVLDPIEDASLLERLTEIVVLISLFTVGLKLELPWRDGRWRIPVQLATVSMLMTVGALAAAGVWLMDLPLGVAVLLGAILAPTDPVLASDVQVSDPHDRDRLRFGLTGEGGFNDGTAFPMVMLGLGLMSLHDLGEGGWRWWAIDLLWAGAGGLALGYALGAVVGRAILYLRVRRREALGPDEFMVLV